MTDSKAHNLSRSASAAIVWNTIFVPLKLLAEVAANLIKANALSQAAFGLLALVSALANTLGVWVDLGIDRALPRFIPEQERLGGRAAVARLLHTVTRIKLVMLIVVAGLFLLYSSSFLANLAQEVAGLTSLAAGERERLLAELTRWGWLVGGGVLILVALGAFYDMLMAYLISFFRHRAWNSIALVTSLLGPLLIIVALALGGGMPGVLLAMVVTPFFAVALATWQVWLVQRALPAVESAAPELLLPRGFVAYTGASHLLNLSDWATSISLAVLVAPGLEQAAVLAIGFQLVRMALAYLFTPLAGVQVPLFTRVRGGEGGTLDGAYQSITRLLLFLMIPGGIGLTLLAQPLLSAFFPKYPEAAALVWVLAPCMFLESALSTAQIVLMVYERYRAVLIARLLAFVSVPLLLLLSPYGPLGAAIALGVARIVARAAALYLGRRQLGLGFPSAFALRVGLASLTMGLVLGPGVYVLGTLPEGTATLGWQRLLYVAAIGGLCGLGLLVFLLALRLLGGLEPEDRRRLMGLKLPLKKLISRLV